MRVVAEMPLRLDRRKEIPWLRLDLRRRALRGARVRAQLHLGTRKNLWPTVVLDIP